MDRSKKRARYASSNRAKYASGSNKSYGAYSMSENNRRKRFARLGERFRVLIILLALAGLIAIAVSYAFAGMSRNTVGRITRIGATLSQNVMPFGDSVIFYDGTTLHCVAATGGNEWSYQIGTNADYDATQERIVAWSGNDLYILNNRGRLIYNNSMSDAIQFASAGEIAGALARRGCRSLLF